MSEQWCQKNSFDVCCILQIRQKIFFFLKFFQPIRIREKIKFNSSIFFSLESRDEWTVMLKKFYWLLLYSPNPREKFFFIKIFRPIRFREKIKFNSSIFFSLESRDERTLMLKKFYWFLLYSPNPRDKIFFSLKFFNQSDFVKKSNWILLLFLHWNRETSEHWYGENYFHSHEILVSLGKQWKTCIIHCFAWISIFSRYEFVEFHCCGEINLFEWYVVHLNRNSVCVGFPLLYERRLILMTLKFISFFPDWLINEHWWFFFSFIGENATFLSWLFLLWIEKIKIKLEGERYSENNEDTHPQENVKRQ